MPPTYESYILLGCFIPLLLLETQHRDTQKRQYGRGGCLGVNENLGGKGRGVAEVVLGRSPAGPADAPSLEVSSRLLPVLVLLCT